MKRGLKCLLFAVVAMATISCSQKCAEDNGWLKRAIDRSSRQLTFAVEQLGENREHNIPRSTWSQADTIFVKQQLEVDVYDKTIERLVIDPAKEGTIRYCSSIYDWTSGFFAGSLWYSFELSGGEEMRESAEKYTAMLEPLRSYTKNHDVGFMVNCSYGHQERLYPEGEVQSIIVETADALLTRYDERIESIRSWDFGAWNFPVIIDNMMNLDLLFNAARLSGDDRYRDLAFKHANTTLANHFRDDNSCYHVVSYNDDGSVESKGTFQGKNDDSSWARGQAWALYGYTSCYRESGKGRYLELTERVADLITRRVETDDAIPYWDLDAPAGEQTPRDASAAAITAAALFELSTLVVNEQQSKRYFDYAERIIRSLSSDEYLAQEGENHGFILRHSTGSLPHGSEIDTPLNYADYYYLESLYRYMKIKGLSYATL